MSGQAPGQAPATSVPDDADDTRGRHFRRLLTHPVALVGGGIIVAAVLLAAGLNVTWSIGVAGAAFTAALVLLTVWLVANSLAHQDFFRAYAEARGLSRLDGHTPVPTVTPLLSKGDRPYAEQRFNGVLPGDIDGSLCLYTYEETSTDSDGDRQTSYYHYTVVLTELPASAPLIGELFCQRRVGFRFLDSMEDVFRERQRVEQESDAVDKAYEIFIGESDQLNRARQILSPTFLLWLERHSPDAYAFELVAGTLVCNVRGHLKSATELDALCAASAAVARRISEEAGELTVGARQPG